MANETQIIGLTGQIGAGKTSVSDLLRGYGYTVIDADVVAREVVQKGKACLMDLVLAFGTDILAPDGSLNRRRLGDVVFADKEKRLELNRITFPHIQKAIFARLDQLRKEGVPIVFLDAPTLFESGTDSYCDKIVSVVAQTDLRRERILARDTDLTPKQVDRRIAAQHDDAFYAARSDFVIRNDGNQNDLRIQVLHMLDAVGADRAGGQERPT
ncbi:MAG: dephospho-CoA kinase [Oscillospiraceae bacterium]